MSRIQQRLPWFGVALLLTFLAMYGQALWMGWGVVASLWIATGFVAGTALLGVLAYTFQAYRQQRALAEKHKAGEQDSLEQSRLLEIDLPFEQAFQVAQEALQTLDGQAIPKGVLAPKQRLIMNQTDAEMGQLRAELRAKTFGIQDPLAFSHVSIDLQRLDAQTTRLKVSSRPHFATEIFDMGRHLHYVNQIALYVRQASQAQSASDHLQDRADEVQTSSNPVQNQRRSHSAE